MLRLTARPKQVIVTDTTGYTPPPPKKNKMKIFKVKAYRRYIDFKAR
jgi:hypothetical protein